MRYSCVTRSPRACHHETLEHFMAKLIAAEETRAELWHTVVYLNGTGRTNERISKSKRARTVSLAIVD